MNDFCFELKKWWLQCTSSHLVGKNLNCVTSIDFVARLCGILSYRSVDLGRKVLLLPPTRLSSVKITHKKLRLLTTSTTTKYWNRMAECSFEDHAWEKSIHIIRVAVYMKQQWQWLIWTSKRHLNFEEKWEKKSVDSHGSISWHFCQMNKLCHQHPVMKTSTTNSEHTVPRWKTTMVHRIHDALTFTDFIKFFHSSITLRCQMSER